MINRTHESLYYGLHVKRHPRLVWPYSLGLRLLTVVNVIK